MKQSEQVLVILLLGLAGLAPGLRAQDSVVPFAGAGLAVGIGDLSGDTDPGWHVFGGLDVPLRLTRGLSLGATGSYARVPYKGGFNEASSITAVSGEVGYTVWAGTPRMVQPYVRAGMGLQIQRYHPGSINVRSTSHSTAGFSGGAGINFDLGPVGIFLGGNVLTSAGGGILSVHGGLGAPGLRVLGLAR